MAAPLPPLEAALVAVENEALRCLLEQHGWTGGGDGVGVWRGGFCG